MVADIAMPGPLGEAGLADASAPQAALGLRAGSDPAPDVTAAPQRFTDADRGTLVAYLEGLLKHADGAMYLRTAGKGRYLAAGAALARIVGRPIAEILGSTVTDLVGSEAANEQLRHDRMIRTDGQARVVTETMIGADGTVHRFVVHKFPLYAPDGSVSAIGGVMSAVTGSDAAIEIGAIWDHAPMGLMFIGPDGLVMAVNDSLCDITGFAPSEIVGLPAIEAVAPESRAQLEPEVVELLAGRRSHLNAVRWLVHHDGSSVPVRMTTSIVADGAGAPRGMMAMVFDLTEDERTREELAKAHAAAIQAAERLTLLHAIATAANEVATLDELVPKVIRIVCDRLGWDAGALVEWPSGLDGAAVRSHQIGDVRVPQLPPLEAEPRLTEGEAGPQVVVPLLDVDGIARALVFEVPETEFSDWQPDLLRLVGGECGRVIEREFAARAQADSNARFRSVFDTSPLAMGLTTEDNGTFTDVNNALCMLVGRTREELVGSRFRALVHPDDGDLFGADHAAAAASGTGPNSIELRLTHSDGAEVIGQVSLAWTASGRGRRLLLVQIEDVTARRAAERALRREASHDALTGLTNRPSMTKKLTQLAAEKQRCALLFVDLDGFKEVNDTFGHEVGDEVLVAVARRFESAVRSRDVVARFGGDEFVVLCPMAPSDTAEDAERVAVHLAGRIAEVVVAPVSTSAGIARVTASVGITAGLLGEVSPQELLQRADAAMYQAKRSGKNRSVVYDLSLA